MFLYLINMSQLLIIDVQNSYASHIEPSLYEKIINFSSNFSEVYYLYDILSGLDLYAEVPDVFIENEDFYEKLNILTKEYGFFRSLMDLGLDADDEELVRLGKFMKDNGIYDNRQIFDDDEIKNKFLTQFKNSPLLEIDFDSYPISLPDDLIESLSCLSSGVVLVGGGRNECLKEISLLLKVLDIKHTIAEDYTY